MSRSNSGSKGAGYEYWKSRHKKFKVEWNPGSDSKRITNKYIRRKVKQQLKDNNE